MKQNNIQKEKCVSCGKETEIPINKHIDARTGYIEGAGQICSQCFIKYFKEVHKKDDDVSGKL